MATEARHFDLLTARRQAEQGARVPHFDAALLQQVLHLVGEVHQPQQIADRGARAADRLRRGLVGQTELLDQPAQGARLLQRIQVLALNVLDERHRDRRLIGHIADDRRYFRDSRHLRRAPAALAGDDFVALGFAGQVARQAAAPGWAAPIPEP